MEFITRMIVASGKKAEEVEEVELYRTAPDAYSFFMDTMHAEFSLEELLSAVYATIANKPKHIATVCDNCASSGGALTSRKEGLLLSLVNIGHKDQANVIFTREQLDEAILHNIL